MTTPMPTDEEIAEELAAVLRSEAERVTPEPALQQILTRAHQAGPTKSTRRRGGWLPVIGGAVATAGLAAAAIVIFAPDEQRSTTEPSVSCAVEVREGCPVELAVYWTQSSLDMVVSAPVTVTSSGNVGLDAVRALLDAESGNPAFVNVWHGFDTMPPDSGPIAEVNEVTHSDGLVTVDFDRPLTSDLASLQGDPSFPGPILQQLVLTVQSALRTDDPVQITVNGELADEAFGHPLTQPLQADRSVISGVRLEAPTQRETVTSPVEISGRSTSFEGNLLWEVTQDGDVVERGHTMGGAMGVYAPFSITVELVPGTYTVKIWEPNEASGSEAWSKELSVVYTDFTVG